MSAKIIRSLVRVSGFSQVQDARLIISNVNASCLHTSRLLEGKDDESHSKSKGPSNLKFVKTVLSKKEPKTIAIKDKIEKHDLNAKINNIKKWLAKGHLVNASISSQQKENTNKSEELYQTISKELAGEGILENKQISNKDMRFKITPLSPNSNENKARADESATAAGSENEKPKPAS